MHFSVSFNSAESVQITHTNTLDYSHKYPAHETKISMEFASIPRKKSSASYNLSKGDLGIEKETIIKSSQSMLVSFD